MALMKSSQIPKDAVILQEAEATTYAWEVVDDWDSLSDTWALRYAPAALGAINAISGAAINTYYRRRFKLKSFGHFSSIIPITVMPGLLTALFHRHLVSTDMLLMKREACPICYEVRSGMVQVTLGTLYPMILGPLAALMFANRYVTYRVPDLQEGTKVIFKFLKGHSKPLSGTLVFLLALQIAASSILTYYEMRNNISIKTKVEEAERKIEDIY